ncbi:MAG: hypothetical protein U0793_24045 [Gemmataceae bacterium]
MKHLLLVACALSFLATAPCAGLAQFKIPPPKDPGDPDGSGTRGHGPGDYVPIPPVGRAAPFSVPKITSAGITKGQVRFTFGACGTETLLYKISWSRPGKADSDIRYTGSFDSNGAGLQDYYIKETPFHHDTVYTFRVQALRKAYTRYGIISDEKGVQRPAPPVYVTNEYSTLVEKTFRTPLGPSDVDRARVPVKATDYAHSLTRKKPNPLSTPRVDTPVRLVPHPIVESRDLTPLLTTPLTAPAKAPAPSPTGPR